MPHPTKRGYYEARGAKYGARYGRYADTGGKYYTTAAKALRAANQVRRLLNVEYKVKGTSWTVDPNSTGAVVSLGAIAQGDDYQERQGRKIKIVSMRSKGCIQLNASATFTTVRCVIVRDNSGTTTQPTIGQVFADAAAMFGGKVSLSDPQSNSRFALLSDKFYTLWVEKPFITFDIYSKAVWHMIFSGTASTDEGKGGLYLMIASNEATNDPVVSASTEIRFIDN